MERRTVVVSWLRATALLVLAVVGCDQSPGHSLPDGVASLHFDATAIQNAPKWGVEPIVEVGTADGGSETLFMVTGATLTSDSTVVVADRGSSTLKVFDYSGRFLRALGRKGNGPGEFNLLAGVWSRGGGLLAWDPTHRRATFFDASGELAEVLTLRAEFLNPPPIIGLTDDGMVVANERFLPPTPEQGVVQLFVDYLHVAETGAVLDSLGRFPWQKSVRLEDANRGPVVWPIFTIRTSAAADQHGFVFGDPQAGEITGFDLRGDSIWHVTWDAGDRTISDAHFEEWTSEWVRRVGDRAATRQMVERWRETVGFADELPAFSEVVVDKTGSVWVRPYFISPFSDNREWLVFGRDGQLEGRVSLPPVRLLEVGSDYTLALQTDEFDVERVILSRIVGR